MAKAVLVNLDGDIPLTEQGKDCTVVIGGIVYTGNVTAVIDREKLLIETRPREGVSAGPDVGTEAGKNVTASVGGLGKSY